MAQNTQTADTEPNANGGTNPQEGGNPPKTYTQEELDSIVSERTGRATKAALKSFFSQRGLSEEEATAAIGEYLENKKKNTPDLGELQNSVAAERAARMKAQLREAGTLEAVRQGVALMKYGEKYGKERLERACESMLEISAVPSIRTIAVILKNGKEPERKTISPTDSEKYGITPGAAYFKKGGDRNA